MPLHRNILGHSNRLELGTERAERVQVDNTASRNEKEMEGKGRYKRGRGERARNLIQSQSGSIPYNDPQHLRD